MKIVRRYYSGSLVVLAQPDTPYTVTNLDAMTVETLRNSPVDAALLPVHKVLIERMKKLRDTIDRELQCNNEAHRFPFVASLFREATDISNDWMWLRVRIPDTMDYTQAKAAVLAHLFYL